MNKIIAIAITLLIAFCACYALGVFDGDGVVKVENKEFSEFTYNGSLKDGLFDGHGSVFFPDGERFNGYFTGCRFDGAGYFSGVGGKWNFFGNFESGSISGGTLKSDLGEAVTLERTESADMLVSDKWLFDGSFNDRGQTGTGTFVFADGSEYTGGFLHGLADGDGIYADSSGRVIYQGEFKEGFFDGQGVYFSPDGWSYEGSFMEGMLHGEGVISMQDESIRGVWDRGVQVQRYE